MANKPIQGFDNGAPALSTDIMIIARETSPGVFKNYRYTVAQGSLPPLPPVSVSADQDVVVGQRNIFGGGFSYTVTFPSVTFPPDIRGQYTYINCVNAPIGAGNTIQCPGVMFFDGIPYSSITPKTFNLSANRTFNLAFWLSAFSGGGYWVGEIQGPFTGTLNGTPYLGVLQRTDDPSDGFDEYSIDSEGNYVRGELVLLTKGSFKTPEGA